MSWYASVLCPGLPLFDRGRDRAALRWMIGTLVAYGLLGPVGFLVHFGACLHCYRVEKAEAAPQRKSHPSP